MHFEEQFRHYGKQVVVSLIDQCGLELDVGEAYETCVRLYSHPDLKYVAYDFHEQCKNNNYDGLNYLVKDVSADLLNFGYVFLFIFLQTCKLSLTVLFYTPIV